MKARPYAAWISRLYIFLVGMLGFTGFMQMPLAKRYYLTEVPGLAWTGDFYVVHEVHYVLAALFLFLLGVVVANWWLEWRERLELTRFGLVRVIIVAGLVVSGAGRVYRSLPDVNLPPAFVMVIEWTHFILVMVLGGVALTALIRKCSAYARWR